MLTKRKHKRVSKKRRHATAAKRSARGLGFNISAAHITTLISSRDHEIEERDGRIFERKHNGRLHEVKGKAASPLRKKLRKARLELAHSTALLRHRFGDLGDPPFRVEVF